MPNHPSSFWFEREKLLLNVYVDDLLLSGPEGAHSKVWKRIQESGVKIDNPEPLDRFLGRHHIVSEYYAQYS